MLARHMAKRNNSAAAAYAEGRRDIPSTSQACLGNNMA